MENGSSRTSRRIAALLALVLAIAGPAPAVRADEPVEPDPSELAVPGEDADAPAIADPSQLEMRIRLLEAERAKVRLAGPITGVALGAIVLQLGLSQIISIQYNCPGYYHCSDTTRWGLTGGAGAAIVVGAATIAIFGPKLSQRLKARRELQQEILDLRSQRNASASRRSAPAWALGFGFEDGRRDLRVSLRY